MVYGERGDMRQASSPPTGLETGFLFLFLGAEWRHIKVSRSTTLTQQKRVPQRECVFEKSLSVRLWLHIPTFSPQRNTFFVFFFCLLIFAIFSHDFITNWKKKKKKRDRNAGSKSAARCPQTPADLCALIKIVHCFSTNACPSGGPLNK